MKYGNSDDLKNFLKECEKEILKDLNKHKVEYPQKYILPWNSEELMKVNKALLDKLAKNANVYAIFTAKAKNKKYSLRYIGQTKSTGARARLTNHLIKKHIKTGAKLSDVMAHVTSGGVVKISWISIHPESLRHYVEEELIKRYSKMDWNMHGKRI